MSVAPSEPVMPPQNPREVPTEHRPTWWDDGPEIDLTQGEIDQLRQTLAEVFDNESRMNPLLIGIGYPRARLPVWTNAVDTWQEVFGELGNGIMDRPWRRLVMAAFTAYQRNAVFRDLAESNIPASPPQFGGPEQPTAAPETELNSPPTIVDDACHVLVPIDNGDEAEHVRRELDRLGLRPEPVWATEHGVSFRVNTAEAIALRRTLQGAAFDYIIVEPGQPDYILRALSVNGPDGRRFRFIEVPAQQTVANIASEVLDQYPTFRETTRPTVVDRIVSTGQDDRLDPDDTLHNAGVQDGDELTVSESDRAYKRELLEIERRRLLEREDEEQVAPAHNQPDLLGLLAAHLLRHPDDTSYVLELYNRHQTALTERENVNDPRSLELVRFMIDRDLILPADVGLLRDEALGRVVQEISSATPEARGHSESYVSLHPSDRADGSGDGHHDIDGSNGMAVDAGTPSAESERRHLVAQAPTVVTINDDFSLIVRITSSAPTPISGTVTAEMSLPLGNQGASVTVVVHPTAGLVPLTGLERVLNVPSQSEGTKPERLQFHARAEGLQRIHLTAWVGGTFLCELTVEVSVHQSARRAISVIRTVAAPIGPLDAENGEVTLQINTAGAGLAFQFISKDFLGSFVHLESRVPEPNAAVEHVINTLRLLAAGKAPYKGNAARIWMKEAGVGLWQRMVPEEIRQQFWELRDQISTFNIAAEDTIPWELLYPLDRGRDEGFLIEGFPVLRRVRGQGRALSLRLEAPKFVASSTLPTTANDEFDSIQRIIGLGEVIHRLEDLLLAIDTGDLGVAHFACHNAFRPDLGSSIDMAGGPFVPELLNSAAAQRTLARSNPLVFLNACRSMGTVPEYTQIMGWAQQFLAAGAGAFIGTLWAVRSETATVFATAFYTALAEGTPLGQAVLAARRAAAAGDGDPTWMAYSAYGDPGATIR